MRSPRGFAAALILLAGAALAGLIAAASGAGAENVVHLTFAASFLVLAIAVFDFKLPPWINLGGCAATGALAAIFLLQGTSDLVHSTSLQQLAYEALGQRMEKILGIGFLLWCAAMLLLDSTGNTRILGTVVLVVILCAEIYIVTVESMAGEAPGFLKLLYLPLFVWLLLESRKPPARQ